MVVPSGMNMLEPAKLVVAIDFGTTFSGFAYVHRAECDPEHIIDNVNVFEEWPSQGKAGARPYCKTQTSLLYVQEGSRPIYKLHDRGSWGWAAFAENMNGVLASRDPKLKSISEKFHFVSMFKLGLAGSNAYSSKVQDLPKGLTVERTISDYLYQLSLCIMEELKKKYGEHIRKRDIQWCLTVPAIWDDSAKQKMKKCAEVAGLVDGPSNTHGDASAHPIMMVLEPEAASVYCLHYLSRTHKTELPAQSKVLIVDAGGGTVDLVLHEKVSSGPDGDQVKEICMGSSGDLCGATFVDDAFFSILSKKIGCFDEFIAEHPSAMLNIRPLWETHKFCFDGVSQTSYEFWLPAKLADYWEKFNKVKGLHTSESRYDDVTITLVEMKEIFDSVVDKILGLIRQQLDQVSDSQSVDAIMVVGGFSGSPYLMKRIKEEFHSRVERIINPTAPGKAVLAGAVVYGGLGKDIVKSRISRKTYGIETCRDFRSDDPESYSFFDDKGVKKCLNIFDVYTRRGDEVAVNFSVKKRYVPLRRDQDCIIFELFSTTDGDPKYVTDTGTVSEGTLSVAIPSKKAMSDIPTIEIAMYFGRTSLEVTATAVNFKGEKLSLAVSFETERSGRRIAEQFSEWSL